MSADGVSRCRATGWSAGWAPRFWSGWPTGCWPDGRTDRGSAGSGRLAGNHGRGAAFLFDTPWVPVYVAVIYLLPPVLGHLAVGRRALVAADSAVRNAEVVDALHLLPGLPPRPPAGRLITAGALAAALGFGGFGGWAALAPLASAAVVPGTSPPVRWWHRAATSWIWCPRTIPW